MALVIVKIALLFIVYQIISVGAAKLADTKTIATVATPTTTITDSTTTTTTSATPTKFATTKHPSDYQLPQPYINETIADPYTVKVVDNGEPKLDITCTIDDILVARKDTSQSLSWINNFRDSILDRLTVKWFKDNAPLWRENGNDLIFTNNFTLTLFTLRISDSGDYKCMVDFSRAPKDIFRYFEVNRGVVYHIEVNDPGLPDIKPTISDPPTEKLVSKGANVTFTCSTRQITLSTQSTYWFKSCPFPKNSKCIKKFLNEFNKAKVSNHPKIYLERFIIKGHDGDTLSVQNITNDQTGYYGCFVANLIGFDIRLGSIEFIERWLQSQPVNVLPSTIEARHQFGWLWFLVGAGLFLLLVIALFGCIYLVQLSIKRDKKLKKPLLTSNIGGNSADGICTKKNIDSREHLPRLDPTDVYQTGRMGDGFISGHLQQCTGLLLSQCSNIHQNLSISSSNSQHSDEASSSWGKSTSSSGDNCKAFYQHTSNDTATTVPMYDHPPSTGTLLRPYGASVRDACVYNPSYGFLRPENDATEWAFPRRNLDRLNKIGEGQFGEVWRYIAHQKDGNGDIVAVKQLKNRAGLGDRERLELIGEIEIMKLVNDHPNVIKLLHYCVDEYEPILLIMEYAENGKLQTYLRSCRASKRRNYGLYGHLDDDFNHRVTSKELIKFTYHIAKGMEYVASKGIVHRDLASRNILVSKDKVCKVADFGFARRVGDDCAYERTTANPVPVKWMAPEALAENRFTTKSDVFSLGILMWEIVTLGATPYESLTSEGVYKKVTTGGRLERPSHCRDEFFSLMAQCWQHDPTQRPTFKEVANQLEKLLLSENDYIELDQYPEHAYYNIINKEEKEIVNIEH